MNRYTFVIVKCCELNDEGAVKVKSRNGQQRAHLHAVVREDRFKKLAIKLRSEA